MQRYVIIHNIRSTHNVGSILRTCDGFGIQQVIFSGYTPYPELQDDSRLPHLHRKLTQQIRRTSLGAELSLTLKHVSDVYDTIRDLKQSNITIIGLEQDTRSIQLKAYTAPSSFALILGEEVEGLTPELRNICDDLVEIPMQGIKESFNVSVATGIALYQLTR